MLLTALSLNLEAIGYICSNFKVEIKTRTTRASLLISMISCEWKILGKSFDPDEIVTVVGNSGHNKKVDFRH